MNGLPLLELEEKSREEVPGSVAGAARRLVEQRGADCVVLGCAGTRESESSCECATRDGVEDLDGVGLGSSFDCAGEEEVWDCEEWVL